MYQYLDLGSGFRLPLYNLLIGIGIVLGVLFLLWQIKQKKISPRLENNILIALMIAIVSGVLGAKLFEILYHPEYHHLPFALLFKTTGYTFLGGFVFGALGFIATNFVLKTPQKLAINLVAPSLMLAHAFGRIGCFLGGCCYGAPTDFWFGVVYPEGSLAHHHFGDSVSLHPVPIYEVLFLLSLFIVTTTWIAFKKRALAYLCGYGCFRFLIEFLRADERGFLLTQSLSPSQTISIGLAVFGVSLSVYFILKKRKQNV